VKEAGEKIPSKSLDIERKLKYDRDVKGTGSSGNPEKDVKK